MWQLATISSTGATDFNGFCSFRLRFATVSLLAGRAWALFFSPPKVLIQGRYPLFQTQVAFVLLAVGASASGAGRASFLCIFSFNC
jgi:hypothetical protein